MVPSMSAGALGLPVAGGATGGDETNTRRAGSLRGTPNRASSCCLLHLPLLDELRTYCYEHTIEELPAFFAV